MFSFSFKNIDDIVAIKHSGNNRYIIVEKSDSPYIIPPSIGPTIFDRFNVIVSPAIASPLSSHVEEPAIIDDVPMYTNAHEKATRICSNINSIGNLIIVNTSKNPIDPIIPIRIIYFLLILSDKWPARDIVNSCRELLMK